MNTFHLSRPEEAVFAPLVHELADILTAQKRTLITAESCTGGLVAALCTDMAGSSAWLRGGVVAYSNAIKQGLLAVPERVLEGYGAVSEETVTAMAIGALACSGDVRDRGREWLHGASLAISGVAGPDGGTADKPVGTVWIAWAAFDAEETGPFTAARGTSRAEAGKFFFPGSRDQIRLAAAREAMRGMIAFLKRERSFYFSSCACTSTLRNLR